MSESFVRWLIMCLVRIAKWRCYRLTPWPSKIRPLKRIAKRREVFLPDEILTGGNWIYRQLPWWAPFNILLHQWSSHDDENELHDHPRWSLTICLKGRLVEKTPWSEKVLTPGTIVFRTHKYIHGFRVEPEDAFKTWTLFVVGRRKHAQNTYVITQQTKTPIRGKAPTEKT